MNLNYTRYDGESDEELIYRITSDKELIGSWQDVADILNGIMGTNYSESKFRKQKQNLDKIFNYKLQNDTNFDDTLKEIEIQKRELERKKIQFRDERRAWNKQNYINARVEQKLNYLEEELKKQGKINFDPIILKEPYTGFNTSLLVMLSDLHIGQCFYSGVGIYDSNIAKLRLKQYLEEIINISKIHKANKCYISLQGDLISGNIHKSIQITNRENVIEQIKLASELISSFCYELTKHFEYVEFSSVVGNHSRIDTKEDALHDERLDDLISWNVECTLNHIDNFIVNKSRYDNGICMINIYDKIYVSVHGDYDPFNRQGVSNLVTFLGFAPYAVLYGHMHTCAFDEVNKIKMIRSGSLAGSGDGYTIEKRLSGKPSQMVCVCDKTGIISYYPVELD